MSIDVPIPAADAISTAQQADFLAALFEADDIVEFRCLSQGKQREHWFRADQVDLQQLQRLNQDGFNIFCGANPRPRAGMKGDACIRTARSLFVDLDNDATVEQAAARVEQLQAPGPSIVVHSGHGVWLYWLLATPLTDLAQWQAAQQRLISAFQSDRTIKNPERIVRVPGFVNHKPPSASAELVGIDPGRRYTLTEIVDVLPAHQPESVDLLAERARTRPRSNGQHLDTSVIDQFNAAHDVAEILTSHGYTATARHGYLYRPGKSQGNHSVEICSDGLSIHYSDNDPLNDRRFGSGAVGIHDAFDVFCQLKHGGDERKAVRAAARLLGIKPNHKSRDKVSMRWAQATGQQKPWQDAPETGSAAKEKPYDDFQPATGEYVLVPGTHQTDEGEYVERGAHDFTDEALARLPEKTLYRRDVVPGQIVGDPGERSFVRLDSDSARIVFDRCMRFGRWKTVGSGENAEQQIQFLPCNRDNSNLILSRAMSDGRVPELDQLTPYPIFVTDYKVSPPGFHDGVFYDEPAVLKDIEPERENEVIRQVLDDLLIDFPFKDEASRQNYIGLLVTVAVRNVIDDNIPGHMIHASLERTGKTKLAEIVGAIFTGHRTPATQIAESNEEMDKRILSLLLKGETLLHLDNLKDWVDLPCLASLLTSRTYRGRILGVSQMPELQNNITAICTGNNIKMTGEIAKRMVPVLLQPCTDAPEMRTDFEHPDLWGYIREHRRQVIACVLGMVLNWSDAGRRRGTKPMGGFDEWAAVVGGIMEYAGYHQWLGNASDWRSEADTTRADLRALVEEWHRRNEGHPMKVGELLLIARELELFPTIIGVLKEGKSLETSFGMRVLSKNVDTPVSDWIIRKNSISRPALYSLVAIKRGA